MKSIILLLFITVSVIGYGQSKDEVISSYMVGVWEHKKTTYGYDITIESWREFSFFSDSTVVTKYIHEGDTIVGAGIWFVKDTMIHINKVVEDSIYVLIDIQRIEHIDKNRLFIARIWGPEMERSRSYYIRKEEN